jgi:hypothetical protein
MFAKPGSPNYLSYKSIFLAYQTSVTETAKSKMVVTRLQEIWNGAYKEGMRMLVNHACAMASDGECTMFLLHGLYSMRIQHEMRFVICFVVLDTSGGVVIPGSRINVAQVRETLVVLVRSEIMEENYLFDFPFYLRRQLRLFVKHEKMQMDPLMTLAVAKALEMWKDRCRCFFVWDRPPGNDDPCENCEAAWGLLLRLGFIVCDSICGYEKKMNGEVVEQAACGALIYPERLDVHGLVIPYHEIGPRTIYMREGSL